MKILFCNPTYYKRVIYLPYVFFKSKQLLKNRLDVEWLDPLIDGSESFDVPYADIVLLSCYVWNIERNVQIARDAKKINPNVIVVAGGPQIPLGTDPFEEYPEFDYVCTTEIENVLPQMLDDFDIPGMRSRTFNNPIKEKLQLNTLQSPWLEYREEVCAMSERFRSQDKKVAFLWETNRGCPYKCTFCDWGSATNSKIRRFDDDMLMSEIDVFVEAKAWLIYIADANFGIFKEELRYIEKICRSKKTYGYPQQTFFSSAKNNKKVVTESYKLLHDAGLLETAHIAFQHTDDDVLEAMDRSNIKTKKLNDEMREAYRLGVPLVGMLILGNPGDTLKKFKKSYYDLFDLGFHEDIKTQDFMILPNAPASDPAYVKKWGIKTIERYHIDSPYFNRDSVNVPKAKYVCSTKSFNEKEYCDMQVFNSFIQGAHLFGATRFVALFMKYMTDMNYQEFYDKLFENEKIQSILSPIREGFEKYVEGKKGIKLIDRTATDIIAFELLLENHDVVLEVCESIIEEKFHNYMVLEDLLNFQKNIVIKWGELNDFTLNYNFPQLFKRILELAPEENPKGFLSLGYELRKYPSTDKYMIGVRLDREIPLNLTKLQWRRTFNRSNERFRKSYKASIIFNHDNQKT